MWVRKNTPGADSFGNTWPEAGAVVDVVDPGIVGELLAIPDGEFSLVEQPEPAAARSTPTSASGPRSADSDNQVQRRGAGRPRKLAG